MIKKQVIKLTITIIVLRIAIALSCSTVLSERMSFPIYCEKYNDWLHEKYEETLE